MYSDADIVAIYEKLRERYPIVIRSSLAVSDKFKIDFPILCGSSALGKFEVLFDAVSFPFYVCSDHGETDAHWHLQTPEELEKTVVEFMEGNPSVIPHFK